MAHGADDGLVVAIDGPSGSGKSTVARAVARALGYRYLDTGSMYRALTWWVLRNSVLPEDATSVAKLAEAARLDVTTDPQRPGVAIEGVDVTVDIRSPEVTAAVSAVSAHPEVRRLMVARQRELIGDGRIVVEGRDIGSTVAPDAPVKVFLTATPEARAERRAKEAAGAAIDAASLSAMADAMRKRDTADSGRKASPLAQAPDAIVIDSTELKVDDVVARIVQAARAVHVG